MWAEKREEKGSKVDWEVNGSRKSKGRKHEYNQNRFLLNSQRASKSFKN